MEQLTSLQRGVVLFPAVPAVLAARRPGHLTGTPRRTFRRIINAGPGTERSGELDALPGAAVGNVGVAVDQVVVPVDCVAAVKVADMPDRVPQLDVGRIGDDGLVVGLELGTVPVGPVQPRRTEELKERSLELATEDHVDDEVDATVDSHQEIADFHHPPRWILDECFVNVRGQRQDVANQEDHHYTQQHRRQTDFAALMTRQLLQVLVRFPDLGTNGKERYYKRYKILLIFCVFSFKEKV